MGFDDVVVLLSSERTNVRESAYFAFETIQKICPRAFQSEPKIPNDYLVSRARTIYERARDYPELDALRLVLVHLYRSLKDANPDLIEPKQIFPAHRERPVIHKGNPSWQLQMHLHQAIETALSQLHRLSPDVRQMTLMLALARQYGVSDVDSLLAILAPDTTISYLPDAARAICITSTGENHFLDAPALAMWKNLSSYVPKSLKHIHQNFAGWIDYQRTQESAFHLLNCSLEDALLALSFTHQSLASANLGSLTKPLSHSALIYALTGQTITTDYEVPEEPLRRRRKRLPQFTKIADLTPTLQRPFSFHSELGQEDTILINAIRDAVKKYASDDKRQSRASRFYTDLTATLLRLINDAHANPQISVVAWYVGLYCTDLMLHGSAHKKRLRASTMLTYLSRLSSFAKVVWTDEQLMSDAQHSFDARLELTMHVAESLSDYLTDSELSTIINFFYYLQQTSATLFFDAQALEYSGAFPANTRAHYISPHDFDMTREKLLETPSLEREQFWHFATLCYRLGLRHEEAAKLAVNDVRFDCGDLIVSNVLLRKTNRAVRRVRLAFLTTSEHVALEQYVTVRKARELESLFDSHVIDALQNEFLTALRDTSGNSEAVIHSLRHSAANNILFQLSLCCICNLMACRHRYLFLQHDVFEEQHLDLIKSDIAQSGRQCDLYFPVLDVLAGLLGHVSPAITMQSYLHLFHLLAFELNACRELPLSLKAFMQLVPRNQYRYEHKARYRKCMSHGSESANRYAFKHVVRGSNNQQYPLKAAPAKKRVSTKPLSFSDYLLALHRYRHEPQSHFANNELLDHFDRLDGMLGTEFYDRWKSRDFPVWLRLFERLTDLNSNAVNNDALATLAALHASNTVTTIRQLKRCLRAFEILGLHELHFTARVPENKPLSQAWLEAISDAAHHVDCHEDEQATSPVLALRPRGLRYAPWSHLPTIIKLHQTYQTLPDKTRIL
ncbi:MAG: tyrosine-type recombinase/integrase [Idiomarina sp.]|nr:tyrosine-type recombinase/integrase [Idiomarina sp.]